MWLCTVVATAQCTLSKAEVQAPVLEPGAKSGAKDEHADLDASYEFSCEQAAQAQLKVTASGAVMSDDRCRQRLCRQTLLPQRS